MRKVHKITACLLCAALVLTCLSYSGGGIAASADETDSETESSEVLTYEYAGHTFSYETEDDGVTITGCTDTDAETTVTELTLPDAIDDESVTAIGDEAFYEFTVLETITLPETLTEIGGSVFYGCTSLTSIELPDALTQIGSSAFYGCTSLTYIELPDALTKIGSSAFRDCSALTSVDLPDGITDIPKNTFRNCTNLANADLPENLKTIQMYAFYNCQSLEEVCFPDSVTIVYDYAYYNCTGITYILLPASDISIRDNNFDQSTNLKTVQYAEGCTRPYTEDGWRNGGSFLSYAETLILPSTLSSLRTGTSDLAGTLVTDFFTAFSGTKEIIIAEDNPYYASYDGCIYDYDLEVLYIVPRAAQEIEFSPYCTTISNGAFAWCTQITEIAVPDTVTKICGLEDASEEKFKYGAFISCYALETLTIPSSVTEIGSSAISGCVSLSYVSLYYDGVYYCFSDEDAVSGNASSGQITDLTIADAESEATVIDTDVFDLFDTNTVDSSVSDDELVDIEAQLETVHLPSSTEEIAADFFDEMTSLTSIEADAESSTYFSENGILYKYADDASGPELVRYPCALSSVSLADGVSVLGERSFYNCSVVKNFEFPDSITEVRAQAFYKSSAITVEFGEGLTTIGDEAFYYCMDSKVVLPEGVTSIGTDAFYTIDASCIVYVYPDSYAEEYAVENGLTYRYTSVYGTDLDTDEADGGALGRDLYEADSDGDSAGSDSSDSDTSESGTTDGGSADSDTAESGSSDSESTDNDSSGSSSSNDSSSADGTSSPDSSSIDSAGISTSSTASSGAAAGTKVTVGNAVYKVTSGAVVTYVKSTKKNTSKVTIPATVKINGKSYKVTAVSASAFAKNTNLKTVVIGKNVTTIGKKAFYNCKNLKKITFKGKNVKSIGAKAFKGTAKKAVVKVPKAKKAAYKKLLKKAGLSAKATVR